MHSQALPVFEPRRRQLSLLRDLECAFEQARRALLSSDILGFESQVARQSELCQILREFARTLADTEKNEMTSTRSQAARKDAKQLEERIRHLNRVQVGFFRRSRRTFEILRRLQSSAALTYDPARPGISVRGGEK